MKKLLLVLCSILLFTGSAFAMIIDFTDSAWQPAHDNRSYTVSYGDLDVTLTADTSWPSRREYLYWEADGIGVNHIFDSQDDEIDQYSSENLRISFSEAIYLSSFNIGDLYYEDGAYEQGAFNFVPGGTATTFAQDQPNALSNGDFLFSFATPVLVTEIWFYAVDSPVHGQGWDFAVAGLETADAAPVPEPATMLLLGVGLVGLAGAGRKKLFKK